MKRILNFKDDFAKKFHGKIIPTREALKLLKAMVDSCSIPERALPNGKTPVVLFESPCPASTSISSVAEVCIFAGEPHASETIRNYPGKSRQINEDEAVRILETKNAKGHVHYIRCKETKSGPFYAICNCCPECCETMKVEHAEVSILVPSGYIAVVDPHKCIGCGQCMEYCPFGAMNLRDKRMRINPKKCMGCGVCTNKCRKDALSLARNRKHPEPLLVDKLK
ncbi:4Fe-4S binding protein [Maridesulfovibrio sp.]|uniref:4Fe-4S binding protein n=1 Tax=Maridesulfovibrio sp. TaxID=2795000 RepID=UPI0029C9E5A9|nr:4Fe-4S binding protein [Maridesulfovibrio sp.]